MRIGVEVDISEVDNELSRLHRGPTVADFMRFDSVLLTDFQATQMVVHVRTGSLQNSGDPDSRYRRRSWEGRITYGGYSPGAVHDPVRYAAYERNRGQLHDFLRPVYGGSSSYIRAIRAFLRGSDLFE